MVDGSDRPSPPDVLTSADRDEIVDALHRYCRGVDRHDWDLVLSAFHDDAVDEHGAVNGTPAELIEWMTKRHRRVMQSMHALTNIAILESSGGRAWVESYCSVHQTIERRDRPPGHLSIGCRYIDLFERRADWRIVRRHVRYDWIHTLAVEQDFLPTSPDLARSARDGSDIVFHLPGER